MKKAILLFLIAQFHLTVFGQQLEVTVDTPGTLSGKLGNDPYGIKSLKITGNLNNDDIRVLDILSRQKLEILDMKEVEMKNENNSIENAFGDNYLTEIYLPVSLKKLDNAFARSHIEFIEIPDSVEDLFLSFGGSPRLKKVYIGKSCSLNPVYGDESQMTLYSFTDCKKLESFSVSEGNKNLSVIDGVLHTYDKKTIVLFPMAKGNKYEIKEGVEIVGVNSFSEHDMLEEIIIPPSVNYIGSSAFFNCKNLKKVYCKNPTPPVMKSAAFFPEIKGVDAVFYIPKGSLNAYLATEHWGKYNLVEYDFENGTSIGDISKETETRIFSVPGGVQIKTAKPIPVSIYNVSGQKVYHSVIDGDKQIHLSTGIYVVSMIGKSTKVAIK